MLGQRLPSHAALARLAVVVATVAVHGCGSDPEPEPSACGGGAPPRSAPDVVPKDPPVFELPAPTGPLAVGTHRMSFIDLKRPEPGTEDPTDNREVVVQLFYPTETHAPAGPLMDAEEAAAVIYAKDWPTSHLDTRTHSAFDVALSAAKARYPLLLYSHGPGGNGHENQALAESLASHGVVVAALSHPFYDAGTKLSSGYVTREEDILAGTAADWLPTWTADVRFVLAELEQLDASGSCSFLSNRLDLQRYAIVGWSTGGDAAHSVCSADPRCQGAVDFDGALSETPEQPASQPLMFLSSRSRPAAEHTWDLVAGRSASTTYRAWVSGISYYNFVVWVSAPGIVETHPELFGSLDPRRAHELYAGYTEAFVRTHLLGEPAPELLTTPSGIPSQAPEVVFERSEAGVTEGPLRVFGTIRDYMDGKPLSGVAVTPGVGAAVTTDASGAWSVDGLAPEGSFSVTLTHSGHFPLHKRVGTGHQFLHALSFLYTPTTFNLALAPAGLKPEAGKGFVLVEGWQCSPGTTIVSGSLPTYYFGSGPLLDPKLKASSGFGAIAALVNVEPGPLQLVCSHPQLRCVVPEARDPAPVIETEVIADTLTHVFVVCEK